jgi:hypothetical protein
MQMGQLQEAMETYRMAIVLNPGLVDAHSNMGNLHKVGPSSSFLSSAELVTDPETELGDWRS